MKKRRPLKTNMPLRFRPPKKPESNTPASAIRKSKSSYNPLISIAAWSKAPSAVGDIFSKVRQIDGLNKTLRYQIGLPLSAHIKLIRIDSASALVVASSGAWASRARYAEDDILRILSACTGDEIIELSIRAHPHY